MGFAYPDISPIMFELGPLVIRWYSMAYLVGLLLGWWWVNRLVKKYDLKLTVQNVEDLVFYCTLGIILGGRLGYVLFYGEGMLRENWLEVFAIWKGGMSFHGGAIGVAAAVYFYSRKIHCRFLTITDLVVLPAPIGLFLGRLANFVNDELWGRVTDVPWAVRFPNGGFLPRHPSQLYEAFFEGIVMFIVLNWLWTSAKVRNSPGFVSGMFVLLYGVFRIFMEQFRQPDAHMGYYFSCVTMGQMLSLPLVVLGLAVIVYSRRTKEN